ncbi:MAG: glycosyltransferase family 9 protein [Planctomycetes bacterium]|nr:glycosyltransferase family 9 protein [Planctomycetota bacterium]
MTLELITPLTANGAPTGPPDLFADDCGHYRGDKPCIHNRLCAGCDHYAPVAHRLCIIKLGALGDVIRTLCILPELHRRHPGIQVTWVSQPNGCRMIAGHPLIDRVVPFNASSALALAHEQFDTVICLDKEPEPCALAMSLHAGRKLGFGLGAHGKPLPLNPEAHDFFALGLSDDLKFCRNEKSYPQLVHEALGLDWRGQRYELPRNTATRDRTRRALGALGWRPDRPTLGVNVGAGKTFANKMWPAAKTADLIRTLLDREPDTQVLLLGGPDERDAVNDIQQRLAADKRVIDPGTDHDEPSFVALIDACDALFSGDTMAMHVAVALNKNVAVLFGPTCEQEIELYGRGEKLIARVECGPCYKRVCDKADACIEDVTVAEAADAVARALTRRDERTIPLPVAPARIAG